MDDELPQTDVSGPVGARVQQIIAEAERSAMDLRAEVETEVFAMGRDIRARAEADAELIRAHAEEEAERQLDQAQRRIEAFASTRIERISTLTDELMARAEAIATKVAEADQLRLELEEMVHALRLAAQAANAEVARPPIRLTARDDFTPVSSAARPAPRSRVLDSVREARRSAEAAAPAPVEDDDTTSAVRDAARNLPRSPRGATDD